MLATPISFIFFRFVAHAANFLSTVFFKSFLRVMNCDHISLGLGHFALIFLCKRVSCGYTIIEPFSMFSFGTALKKVHSLYYY